MVKTVAFLLAALVASADGFVVKPTSSRAIVGSTAQQRRQQDSSTARLHVFDFLKQGNSEAGSTNKRAPRFEPVTVEPDFRVAGLFLALGAVLDTIPYIQWTLGLLTTALGLLFLVQTFRLRFVFDEENCLALQSGDDVGENVVVGGANRWACDTIVNYDFFPKGWIDDNPIGPVLVYFKETQTPRESWNDGPGRSANGPEKIAAGEAVAGQVHFFPAVCNAQQIRAEFEKRGCGKVGE